MGSKETAEIIRRGYDAFNNGDMETLEGLFAEDAVWEAVGLGPLSGEKRGRAAILEFFRELGSRSDGTAKTTLLDIIADENRAVALQHNHAERNGRSLSEDTATVYTLSDGKVTKARDYSRDTARGDQFWS